MLRGASSLLSSRSSFAFASVLNSVSRRSFSVAYPPPTSSTHTPDGRRRVTIAYGDGIGPEIMDATLRVLRASGAKLEFEEIEIGEKVYGRGVSSGIDQTGWDSLNRTKIFLKSPITTPLGGGVKSLNVTVRKTLGLYANIRPVVSYSPYVPALHNQMDMVVIRENEEDLYAGIEHRHTSEVLQCIKLITIPGSMRICKYAFDYAMHHHRKKVTCVSKNNIMKVTDGAFSKVFYEVAKQYPDIKNEHKIVDIATAQVAARPGLFDVLVTTNLYGDIISDVAAEVAGSVGLAGSANVGDHAAMFEAIHGSAPDIAGSDIANPAGLLNGAIMMLGHIGDHHTAATIKNALLRTLEDGIHTADIYRKDSVHSQKKVGTREFADAVIARLGQAPQVLRAEVVGQSDSLAAEVPDFELPQKPVYPMPSSKDLVGVDIFVDWEKHDRDPNALAAELKHVVSDSFDLQMISNRGVKVWPNPHPDTYKVDHWRCRFVAKKNVSPHIRNVANLMALLIDQGIDVIKTENLYNFDGEAGYSLGQGQ